MARGAALFGPLGPDPVRPLRYHVVASTRFREYLPPEVTGQPERVTIPGQQVEVAVPSTVRPPAPKVSSVLPDLRVAA
jgi:hypothetical protein